jgi:hypothetical protein
MPGGQAPAEAVESVVHNMQEEAAGQDNLLFGLDLLVSLAELSIELRTPSLPNMAGYVEIDLDAVESSALGRAVSTHWDELALCESGMNNRPRWDVNTGNGYYGGLQFDKPSWDWAGGEEYAEWPHQATREEQIEVAEKLLSIHPAGIGAWPECSQKLGLR